MNTMIIVFLALYSLCIMDYFGKKILLQYKIFYNGHRLLLITVIYLFCCNLQKSFFILYFNFIFTNKDYLYLYFINIKIYFIFISLSLFFKIKIIFILYKIKIKIFFTLFFIITKHKNKVTPLIVTEHFVAQSQKYLLVKRKYN